MMKYIFVFLITFPATSTCGRCQSEKKIEWARGESEWEIENASDKKEVYPKRGVGEKS